MRADGEEPPVDVGEADADPEAIATASARVLDHPDFADAAKRMAVAIATYPGAQGAVDALQRL